jgi:hypothetical protein
MGGDSPSVSAVVILDKARLPCCPTPFLAQSRPALPPVCSRRGGGGNGETWPITCRHSGSARHRMEHAWQAAISRSISARWRSSR